MLEKIGKNLGKVFLLILGIILFIGGYQCGRGKSEKTVETKTVINYRDTIFPKDTILTFKDRLIPYPVYIHDSIKVPKPLDSLDINRFYVYKDSVEDANVKIYSNIVTQGKTLSSFKPSYKLKVPLIIKDSTVVQVETTKPYKYEIHAGLIATPKMLAPTLDLSMDKWTYTAGYDPFNKQFVAGLKYRVIGWTPKEKKK